MASQGKGTPPRVVDLESLARGYTEAGIKRLGGYAMSPKSKPPVAIKAIELLLDRGWGKAAQQHKVTGTPGSAPVIVEIVYRPREIEKKK